MDLKLKKSIYLALASASLLGATAVYAPVNNVSAKTTKSAAKHKVTKKSANSADKKITTSMTTAEKALADQKYETITKIAKKHNSTSNLIKKADKSINSKMPFNKKNYENEYIYALNHPSLIRGGQGAAGGQLTGISDGLYDFVQYNAMLSTKQYAKDHNYSDDWVADNLKQDSTKTYTYWYIDGFHDLLGGDNYDGAKRNGGQAGLDAYNAGLKLATDVQDSNASDDLINYTKANLSNTVFKQQKQLY